MLLPLQGSVKSYSWGSATALPHMFGWAATGAPMAEVWLGAHPAGPATALVDDRLVPLDQLMAEQPHLCGALGLPFLLKVLAAERALSLQAHPDAEQAAAGFAAEELAGVPRDAPQRRFRDACSKAEMVVALTPFRALAGVREPTEALRVVAAFDRELPFHVDVAEASSGALATAFAPLAAAATAEGVTGSLRAVLSLPPVASTALVAALCAAAPRLSGSRDPAVARYADLVDVLGVHHPGDVGIVAALLLNDVSLAPGQSVYLPARSLHAYVQGTAVELMISSDNVLRGGLTNKHVDVDALLDVVDATPSPPVRPQLDGQPIACWSPPDGAFVLHRVDPSGEVVEPDVEGPAVVLAVEGAVDVAAGGEDHVLLAGQAVLVPASDRVTVSGAGLAYMASCGRG